MSQRQNHHLMEPLERGQKLSKRLIALARVHLIKAVVAVLILSWIGISYAVYLAEYQTKDATITTFSRALWWGIVTVFTVGYGDYTPLSAGGRVWGGGLMFVGVFGVAIITSKISSYFLEQALREGRGVVETEKLRNHFIICGWKEELHELLTHILDFDTSLQASDIVLVANLSPTIVDELHAHPKLKNLQIVVGDYFQVLNLKRAAPERARKVLILADRTPGVNGQVASATEVDARTIMTAMTLSSIARGTLVTAEILDPKMDQYLKLASVSEIIYSREYSRLLLGNAAGGTGVSNIIFDLLDPKTPTVIATRPIAENYLQQAYPDFKIAYEGRNPNSVVIGILENTGNSHTIKELALRQAQKTPDMGRLVQNLRSVKELQCNHPVFHPSKDYLVPEGAMVIVVETRVAKVTKEAKNAGIEKITAAA